MSIFLILWVYIGIPYIDDYLEGKPRSYPKFLLFVLITVLIATLTHMW